MKESLYKYVKPLESISSKALKCLFQETQHQNTSENPLKQVLEQNSVPFSRRKTALEWLVYLQGINNGPTEGGKKWGLLRKF